MLSTAPGKVKGAEHFSQLKHWREDCVQNATFFFEQGTAAQSEGLVYYWDSQPKCLRFKHLSDSFR